MATVTDQNKELTLQLYSNPLLLQDKVLSLFENHVFGGRTVMDGNNVFTFGLEMEASMLSSIVNEMSRTFESLYPARAKTIQDIYRHMSDYDYVGMYAYPSQTTIQLLFDRDWIIENATNKKPNSDSYLIRLPQFSRFTIGNYNFGIYYPINIEIKKAYYADGKTINYNKCMIHCEWDTTIQNPLHKLQSNIIEHRLAAGDGLTFLCLQIPVHQFDTAIYSEDAVASTGFIKRYDYYNFFYAARIFHWFNGAWRELHTTLSDVVYNPSIPTAKLKVLTDLNQVEVSIPQIYFSSGLIGNKIMMILHTTKGELDVDISNYPLDQFSASFLVNDEIVDMTYSSILKRLPTIQVMPTSSRISNGSNGKTLSEIKNRILNTVGGDDLLVTTNQLAAHLYDEGFGVVKYIDNITDRIWLAKRILTDSDGYTIASALYKTMISTDILNKAETDYPTIKISNMDNGIANEFVILPNSIFRYNKDTDSMELLSKYDVNLLNNMGVDDRLAELNNNKYTITPFHVKLSTKYEVPICTVYDLFVPEIYNTNFIKDNIKTSTQISMYASQVKHLNNGTGGYKVSVATYKTTDLANVPAVEANNKLIRNFAAILRVKSNTGTYMFMIGKYVGKNDDDRDIFEFEIKTDYKINSANCINTSSFQIIDDYSTMPSEAYVNLESECDIIFYVNKKLIDNPEAHAYGIAYSPKEMKDMVFVSQQSFTLKLGKQISSLKNNVFTTITGEKYETYNTTEFVTYPVNTYKRYETAEYKVTEDTQPNRSKTYYTRELVDGTYKYIEFNELSFDPSKTYYEIVNYPGDYILDEEGHLKEDHYAGDLIMSKSESTLDQNGYLTPSMQITQKNVDTQLLFLSPSTASARANILNKFVPYYVTYENARNEETGELTNEKLYKGVLTGYSSVEIKDMLKEAIDVVFTDNESTNQIYNNIHDIEFKFEKDEIGSPLSYSFNGPSSYFVFVNDSSLDTAIYENEYLLEKDNESNKYRLIKTLDSKPQEEVYGSLYRLDLDLVNYDYSKLLTNEELNKFYQDCDKIDPDTNRVIGLTPEILSKYKLQYSEANTLIKMRFPWIRIVTCKESQHIQEYWNTREALNFNKNMMMNGHVGLDCLNFIQTICKSLKHIKSYATQEEAVNNANELAVAGDDNLWDIVWCENYNPTTDIESGTLSDYCIKDGLFAPLITEMEEGNHTGALLINYGRPNVHYTIITGPTLQACINKIQSYCTFSGMMYVCNMYDIPDDIKEEISETTFDSIEKAEVQLNDLIFTYSNRLNNKFYALINTDINFENNSDESVTNWPWEVSNWYNVVGENLKQIETSLDLNIDATDVKIAHLVGDPMLDEFGKPVPEQDTDVRKLIYNIDLIHYDYNYLQITDYDYQKYQDDTRNLLRNFFDVINNTKPQLIERTRLYYSPIRTFGDADFKSENGEYIRHNLDIELGFRLHVPSGIISNEVTKNTIYQNILTIVQKHLNTGSINCADIANEIKSTLSSAVFYIDILGIDKNQDLQTLISSNENACKPRLKSILFKDENNEINMKQSLTLEWAVLI